MSRMVVIARGRLCNGWEYITSVRKWGLDLLYPWLHDRIQALWRAFWR
ncbi:unnamed protein product [marine sediment metagenome]|uniref:Uncharacterized protein n=1 Tax=marine sediment metagenome TaxID=412755 RepID=X0RTZ0_9ZZZZ